jgi:MYND finger
LTYCELSARYNFSLLLLQRAWQAHWTPETHASFQPNFRAAVVAVVKCTHRLGLPHETMLSICSFLGRDWWEDSRAKCWRYACLFEKSTKAINRKMSPEGNTAVAEPSSPVASNLEYCSQCHIAMYCSKGCRNRDHYIGHKAKCNRPPMLATPPDDVETQLYVDVLAQNGDFVTLPKFLTVQTRPCPKEKTEQLTDLGSFQLEEEDDNENNANDDGSWETVDSDEEETEEEAVSKTQKIWKYFYDHSA